MEGYPIQTNFTSGEVSPLLRGRTDVTKYYNGAERVLNYMVKPQGAVTRRPGTEFCMFTSEGTALENGYVKLKKFVFNNSQSYILEFGDEYMRIIKNGEYVLDGPLPLGVIIDIATPYTLTHLPELKFTQSADVMYITHPLVKPMKLLRHSEEYWELVEFENQDGPYMDYDVNYSTMTLSSITNRGTITSTANDFVVGDVGKFIEYIWQGKRSIGKVITYVDQKTITIEPYHERIIDSDTFDKRASVVFAPTGTDGIAIDRLRASLTIWTAECEGAYFKIESPARWCLLGARWTTPDFTQLTVGTGTVMQSFDAITVNTSYTVAGGNLLNPTGVISFSNHVITATLKCSNAVFDGTRDLGRQFRLNFSGEQVWGYIDTVTNTKEAAVILKRMLPLSPDGGGFYVDYGKTVNWRWGAWYVDNYPSCSSFHEERLWFGGTPAEPITLWSSRSADFENFSPTETDSKVLDDNAITVTLATSRINSIQWLMSSTVMLVGTSGAEWRIGSGSGGNEPITPSNIASHEQTAYGSMPNIIPQKVGSGVLFIQNQGNVLRELAYEFQSDSFQAKDLTVVSEHILRENGGATDMTYQSDPNSIVWIVTGTGKLVGLTYEKDQEVYAWHQHQIGGSGIVQSIDCISENGKDVVYMAVWRVIGGVDQRTIERMCPEFDHIVYDQYYLDSATIYKGTPISHLGDLFNLTGQTVSIMGDGSLRDDQVVEDIVELAEQSAVRISGSAASTVIVGYPCPAYIKILPLEAGSASGTAQGKIKRVNAVGVKFYETIGAQIGIDESTNRTISFRGVGDPMDLPLPLFTGDKVFDLPADYVLESKFMIGQFQPYASTILSLMPQVHTYK